MISAARKMLMDTTLSFIDDEALSRGAAIAFYAITSLAPVLLIVIAVAGLVFGQEAAQNALSGQFSALMGKQAADLLEAVIVSASADSSGVLATIIGMVTLIATASGVFGEMQAALNTIWKTRCNPVPSGSRPYRKPWTGGGSWLSVDCFARRERRPDGFRQLPGYAAGRCVVFVRIQFRDLVAPLRRFVRGDIQGPARSYASMEGCDRWRIDNVCSL